MGTCQSLFEISVRGEEDRFSFNFFEVRGSDTGVSMTSTEEKLKENRVFRAGQEISNRLLGGEDDDS